MSEDQNVYVALLNKVRKLWVSKISDEKKKEFKSLEKDQRFLKYQKIDADILDTYTKLLYDARQKQVKVNTDTVLENAVDVVIEKI